MNTKSGCCDGDPLMGTLNAKGYEKIAIFFDQYLAISPKGYKIVIVTTKGE